MIDKKDGTLVIHLPKSQEIQIKRLAEIEGMTASEKLLEIVQIYLHDEFQRFEHMKSVFADKD